MKLQNKVAFVTGASSGMGYAIALKFAGEGATVIAVARRADRLAALAAEAPEGKIIAKAGDVSDAKGITALMEECFSQFGKIDILVNNAGVMDEMMPAAECTDELYDKVMDTNLRGPFVLCRTWLQRMLDKGGGVIVNIASIGGLNGSRAGASYTASKHAVVGLSKNIAYMYAQSGVRCNVIAPGAVDTEISAGITNPSQFGMGRAMSGMGANPRSGSAEEIANVALFLASDESSFVNGAVVTADGGWSAY